MRGGEAREVDNLKHFSSSRTPFITHEGRGRPRSGRGVPPLARESRHEQPAAPSVRYETAVAPPAPRAACRTLAALC